MGLISFLASHIPRYRKTYQQLDDKEENPFSDTAAIVDYKGNKSESYPEITASTVPQWSWNREQCRTWLCAVFISNLHWSPRKAKSNAKKFKGFGPNLYLRDFEQWAFFYGDAGYTICVIMLSFRRAEGAVPEGVYILHGSAESWAER